MMSIIAIKKGYVLKWKAECGPRIVKKIEKERKKSGKWKIKWNGSRKHEVFYDNLVLHARKGHVVLLQSQSCPCGK